ncbi:hypothetical protein [Negadavirga shengliensis]|uniref:DoxX-like family protein n=1 Tax=Negadavirga shengliensis TaxID=1389218 RepID=A0ABV9T5K2_9BACT
MASVIKSRNLLMLQGWYYLLTGIWPLIHIESFMWVTGPKLEIWLVKTVGVIITMVGTAFLLEAHYNDRSLSMKLLAVLAALGFIYVDIHYVARGTIHPVYLTDAFAQSLLVLFWMIIWLKRKA